MSNLQPDAPHETGTLAESVRTDQRVQSRSASYRHRYRPPTTALRLRYRR